jgi:hypothetical protein
MNANTETVIAQAEAKGYVHPDELRQVCMEYPELMRRVAAQKGVTATWLWLSVQAHEYSANDLRDWIEIAYPQG